MALQSITKLSKIVLKKLEINIRRHLFTKPGPFESVTFNVRKLKVMTPFSKDPITFGVREQVIYYIILFW